MSPASLGMSASCGTSSAPKGREWKSPNVFVAHRRAMSYHCVERLETESVIVPASENRALLALGSSEGPEGGITAALWHSFGKGKRNQGSRAGFQALVLEQGP